MSFFRGHLQTRSAPAAPGPRCANRSRPTLGITRRPTHANSCRSPWPRRRHVRHPVRHNRHVPRTHRNGQAHISAVRPRRRRSGRNARTAQQRVALHIQAAPHPRCTTWDCATWRRRAHMANLPRPAMALPGISPLCRTKGSPRAGALSAIGTLRTKGRLTSFAGTAASSALNLIFQLRPEHARRRSHGGASQQRALGNCARPLPRAARRCRPRLRGQTNTDGLIGPGRL